MMNAIWKKSNKKGFTLVELLVVIVILGILATLAIQSFSGRTDQARVNRAKGDVRTTMSALELYRMDNGAYPSTALFTANILLTENYMKKLPSNITYASLTPFNDYDLSVQSGVSSFGTASGLVTPGNLGVEYP